MFKTVFSLLLCTLSLRAEVFFSPEMIQVHMETYSEKEKDLIEKDLGVVKSICWKEMPAKERPTYLATAGAPGSRKTTILERFISFHPEYSSSIYLDPDQRGLRFMSHTFYSQGFNALTLSTSRDYAELQKAAYDKWRFASNYVSLTLLEQAFAERKDIAYGTTSTGDHIGRFFEKVRDAGYKIVLLLCSCEDDLRKEAILYRNEVQRFYQCSPEDAVNKGKFFPQRLPFYFTYADTLYFFWSDSLFAPERLAAIFENGELIIHDPEAFAKFGEKYEKDRLNLLKEGKTLAPWESFFSTQND